jgi:anti-sigma factor RsiW
MAKTELSCRELVELITNYLEEALSDEELARFEVHIAACAGCETYLDQIRQTSVALGQLTEGAIYPEARNALIRAFRNWRRPDGSAAAR